MEHRSEFVPERGVSVTPFEAADRSDNAPAERVDPPPQPCEPEFDQRGLHLASLDLFLRGLPLMRCPLDQTFDERLPVRRG